MNVGATGDGRVGESRSTGWPLLSRPVGIITRMIYSWREEKTGWLISIQKAGFQFFFLYLPGSERNGRVLFVEVFLSS